MARKKKPEIAQGRRVFCVYTDTLCQGSIPAWRDERENPCVYETRHEAEVVIAESVMAHLEMFLKGEWSFGDAINIEDYVVEVEVFPDGSIKDDSGEIFSRTDGKH